MIKNAYALTRFGVKHAHTHACVQHSLANAPRPLLWACYRRLANQPISGFGGSDTRREGGGGSEERQWTTGGQQ